MFFSKRHYTLFAKIIFELENKDSIMIKVRKKMIDIFKADNPKFDESKFNKRITLLEEKNEIKNSTKISQP